MSVRIKIPTVTLEDKWSSTPLRRNRFTAKHLRLAVIFAFVISLIINIYYFTRPQIQETPRPYIQPKGANARNRPSPDSIASREHDFDHGSLTNLVVVPGHAIYLGNQGRPMDNAEWSLKSFQKHDIKSIMAHIKRGIQVANDDKKSLLIFSGGATNANVGSRTEAQGYWLAAEHSGMISADIWPRIRTEEFALDSYQNLLYSICRFHEITGNYPQKITVVGYNYKRERFIDLHRKAISYPESKFEYIGVNPSYDLTETLKGEAEMGYIPFSKDLYGCKELLHEKRVIRNPFKRQHGYTTSCPELSKLLEYCSYNSGDTAFDGPLPWK